MIWLIGNKGMLGTELSLMLKKRKLDFVGTDREVDITNPEALATFLETQKTSGIPVTLIVNCAAYTAVDKAEDDIELCTKLNVEGPTNIAFAAHSCGANLLHISTDYVFNGKGERPYTEEDETDPIGVYGRTKRDGELAAIAQNPNTWVIRTSWLYGVHGNNFVYTMLKLMNERSNISVVDDQRGSPTWAKDLCEAICDFAENKPPFGFYHFSNMGNITWFDFAKEILALGTESALIDTTKPCKVYPCTSAEFPAKVTRPAYSVLDKTKIQAVLNKPIPDWKISLQKFLYEC
ncbi:MAG TPA: dTDP-4-dehydrorhamnose reductase [Treponemataceae bacterium]|nr:dTDP-4-dehydrorhamnose reductase [Treponemataceae bacterium]